MISAPRIPLFAKEPAWQQWTEPVEIAVSSERQHRFATTIDWPATPLLGETPPTYHYVLAAPAHRSILAALFPDGLPPTAVHAAHRLDIVDQPARRLMCRAALESAQNRPRGAAFVIHLQLHTPQGALVSDQWETIYAASYHTHEFGTNDTGQVSNIKLTQSGTTMAVSGDLPARYTQVSGDTNPIHLDPQAARRAGMHRPILHGMATLSLACTALVQAQAAGQDGCRLTGIGARFRRPVVPPTSLLTRWAPAQHAGDITFECVADGAVVLDRGWLTTQL